MRRLGKWGVLLGLVALAAGGRASAAVPLQGNWHMAVVQPGQEITLCLLHIEDKGGKPQIQVLGGTDIFSHATVEDAAADDRSLHCILRTGAEAFTLTVPLSAGADRPSCVKGSLVLGDQAEAVLLRRTEESEYDQKKAFKASAGGEELNQAMQTQDSGEQVRLLTSILKKQEGKPVTLHASQILLAAQVQSGADAGKLEAAATGYLKRAAEFGPGYEQFAHLEAARILLSSDKGAALALSYARKVEKEVPEADTPRTVALLKVLSRALHRRGEDAQAKAVDERLEAREQVLDEEFRKRAVPFEPDRPAERTRSSERVVLLELFTGSQCPPCVAADIAFDAALQVYQPSEVVLLQYHLHVPGPDALTNADGEARAELYGDAVQGTPATLLNGKATKPLGGAAEEGKNSYGTLRSAIEHARSSKAEAQLRLDVKREGDRIDLNAHVSGLQRGGKKVRLRFVLVEEVVRYPGSNRQRLHHHVVRAFPGGVQGFSLGKDDSERTVSMTLPELRKQLNTYLDKAAEQQPFPDDERPLQLASLKAVVFIQNDETKEVLQAAQADVPGIK
jgi:hypothetical protein